MYGAALGDIIGEPYEFSGLKPVNMPLFTDQPRFTDDTVMTAAIAEALTKTRDEDDIDIREKIIDSLHEWGKKYPDAGYGGSFTGWLGMGSRKPYYSFGNGAAMRASAAGWLARSLPEALRFGELSAIVTHDHPEGIKGAKSVAASIYIIRDGKKHGLSEQEIKGKVKDFNVNEIGYDLSATLDEIRSKYTYEISCQKTVPPALIAFLESTGFESAVRNAVSLGGDADTLGCITGSIAEALYGVPEPLKDKCREIITEDINEAFMTAYGVSEADM